MKKPFEFQFLNAPAFNSKVKSDDVKNSERWLGYCLGPAVIACMSAICSQSYLNVFYTDVLNLSPIAGGLFLALMPVISKIIDAITNIIMGQVIDKTSSKQGKARPWILFSGVALALSSVLLFCVPESSTAITVIWVTASYNLYFCVAYTMYNISCNLMIPLSTRDNKQRDTLAMANSIGISVVPGMLVSMLFPMFLLPYMGTDKTRWMIAMSIIGILAIPATMIQYYFTRERITEENQQTEKPVESKTLLEQLKGCFASKYWVVIIGIFCIYQLYNNLQVTSTVYYCNWVLGTYNDGITTTLVNAIGQAPLGIGIVALWPLVRKFGKRNVMMVGAVIGIIGCVICALNPTNMGAVLGGLVIKSIGTLPLTYILLAMLADALDHVEWVNGFRCDGLSSSVYSIIITVTAGISMGIFNLLLGQLGYVAPLADGSWVPQNDGVQMLFIAGLFIVPAVGLFVIAFLLSFFNIEKELPQIQKDIEKRRKQEA